MKKELFVAFAEFALFACSKSNDGLQSDQSGDKDVLATKSIFPDGNITNDQFIRGCCLAYWDLTRIDFRSTAVDPNNIPVTGGRSYPSGEDPVLLLEAKEVSCNGNGRGLEMLSYRSSVRIRTANYMNKKLGIVVFCRVGSYISSDPNLKRPIIVAGNGPNSVYLGWKGLNLYGEYITDYGASNNVTNSLTESEYNYYAYAVVPPASSGFGLPTTFLRNTENLEVRDWSASVDGYYKMDRDSSIYIMCQGENVFPGRILGIAVFDSQELHNPPGVSDPVTFAKGVMTKMRDWYKETQSYYYNSPGL